MAQRGSHVTTRRRLDAELVRRGLVPSRARAVEAIEAGRVLVGGAYATSAARQVSAEESVSVGASEGDTYVSRGGHKLAAGLDAFGVDVRDRRAADVGASTGGFTDCLLQRGARSVVAIDVGRGQLAWSLRQDPRVTVMERTNVRTLAEGAINPPVDICVVDVSFISLCTVAPSLRAMTAPAGDFVLLVKPQFEAGRSRVGRGGIVRDPEVHEAVLREVIAGLEAEGLGVHALVASPLQGADGNVEFLAHAKTGSATVDDAVIEDAVRHAPSAA
jgi:23S rRNA (cytidine1920-2'-O)/16S rRNA (cytidine1409-2'-O)-methyltransferase